MRKGWLRPGEPADDNYTQYVMPDTFNPGDRGNFGHEVIFTPKGMQAPPELVNYTPATGEVHDIGQPAPPEHEQLSLRPTAPGPSPGVYPTPAPEATRPLSSRGWAGSASGAVGMGSDDDGDGYDDETGEYVGQDDGSSGPDLSNLPESVQQTLRNNPAPPQANGAASNLNERLRVLREQSGGGGGSGTTPPKANDNSVPHEVRTTAIVGGNTNVEPGDFTVPAAHQLGVIPAGGYSPVTQQGKTPIKIFLGPNKGYDLYDPTSGEKVGHIGPGDEGAPGAPAKPTQTQIYLGPGKGYDVYEGTNKVGHIGPGASTGGSSGGTGGTVEGVNIDAIAQQEHVDPGLLRSLINEESGGHQSAVSPVGAIGLTQLMPGTAAGLGVNPHDPTQNVTGGARYLKQLLDQFGGDTHRALIAYNAGPAGGAPAESVAYADRVIAGAGAPSGSAGTSSGGETVRIRDPKTGGYTVYDVKTNAVVGHIGPDGTSTSATPAAGANSRFRPVTDSHGNVITVDQATGDPNLISAGNPWKVVPTGNGGQMRVNVETGVTQQLSTEASRQAGQSIVQINSVTGKYEEVFRAPAQLKVAITADGKRITTIDPDTGAGRVIWVEDQGGIRNIPGMGLLVPPGKKLTVQTPNGPVIYDGGKPNGPPVRTQDIPAQSGRSGPPQGTGGPSANPARVVDTANAQPGQLSRETWNPDNIDQARTGMQAAEGAASTGADQKVPSTLQLFGALDYRGRESQLGPFVPGAGPGPAGQGDSIYDAWKQSTLDQNVGDPTAGINDSAGGINDTSMDTPDYSQTTGPAGDAAPEYTDDFNTEQIAQDDTGDGSGGEPDVGWGQRIGKGAGDIETSPGPPLRDPSTGTDPNANPVIDPPPPPPPANSNPDDFGPPPSSGGSFAAGVAGSRGAGSTSFGGVRGRLSGRLAAGRSLEGWEPTHAATSTDVLSQELASSTGAPPPPPPTPEPPAVGTGADSASGTASVPPGGWTPPISPDSIVGGGNKFGDSVSMEGVHKGTDLQAVKGTPTVAPVAGLVTRVEFKKQGLGLQVVIRDEHGQEHRLSHLDKATVKEGEFVEKGQPVATVGESGTGATGPHLDYRVEQNGQEVNPEPMMGDLANLPPHPDTIQEDGSVGAAGSGVGIGEGEDPPPDDSGDGGTFGQTDLTKPFDGSNGDNGGDSGGDNGGDTQVTDPFDTSGSGDGSSGQFDPTNAGVFLPSGAGGVLNPRVAASGASSSAGRSSSGGSSGSVSHDALKAAEDQIAWDREKFAQQLAWEQSQFGQQLGWDQSKFTQDLTWQQQKWMQDLGFQHDKLDVEVQRLNSDAQAEEKRYQLNIQQAQTQRAQAVEEMRHNRAMELLGKYQAQLDERNQALNRTQQRVLQGTYAQHRQADLQDSALKNPWVQSLTGMAPEYGKSGGPGWTPGATPNGYQTLMGGYTPVAPAEEPWEPIPTEPTAPGTDVSGSNPDDPANKWLNEFLSNTSSTGPNAIVNPNTPTPAITPIKLPPPPTFNSSPINLQAPGTTGNKSYSTLADAMYGEGLQGVGHYNVDQMSQDDLNDWLKHLWEGGSGWDDPRIVKIMDAANRSGYDTSIYNQWKNMGNQPLGSPFPSGGAAAPRSDPAAPPDTSTLGDVIRDPSINDENPNIGVGQRSKKRRRRVGKGSMAGSGVHSYETSTWSLPHVGPERRSMNVPAGVSW